MSTDPGNLDVTTGAGSALPSALDEMETLAVMLDFLSVGTGADAIPFAQPANALTLAAAVRLVVGSHSDLLEALRSGLAAIDAAYAACPVNSSQRSVEVCPKCGATDRQNCGQWVRAAALMEEGARAALARALGNAEPAQVENPGPGITND